jgi:hypothetical protein
MNVSQRRAWFTVLLCLTWVARCSEPISQGPSPAPATQAETPVRPAFVYQVGQKATYCLSSEVTRSVQFEGIRPDDQTLGAFASAITGRLTDVTWKQTVQAVDPNGQASLLIEITGLDYKGYRSGELVVDFDSTRDENESSALEDVPGLTYLVRVDAKGHVVRVMGQDEALARLNKDKPHFASAGQLVSLEAIQARHAVKAFHGAPDQAARDTTWTVQELFAFGQLGSKRFDKTYTCAGAKEGSSLVEIRLAGVDCQDKSLSSANLRALAFSSDAQFKGTLILDAGTGHVKTYHETLEVDWVFVDSASAKEAQPRKGRMTARQAFLLERKDSPQ